MGFQIFGSHETWSTWMPVFVGNCFQTVILAMCIYFDCVKPTVERVSGSFVQQPAAARGSDPLVDDPPRERVNELSSDPHLDAGVVSEQRASNQSTTHPSAAEQLKL